MDVNLKSGFIIGFNGVENVQTRIIFEIENVSVTKELMRYACL